MLYRRLLRDIKLNRISKEKLLLIIFTMDCQGLIIKDHIKKLRMESSR